MTSDLYGPYKGVVEKVQDGDTLYIKLDLGFDLTIFARVRVFGINAPELSTDAGQRSANRAREIVPVGSRVEVMSHGWDKYGGRIDGDITLVEPVVAFAQGERDFATIMVRDGYAVNYRVR